MLSSRWAYDIKYRSISLSKAFKRMHETEIGLKSLGPSGLGLPAFAINTTSTSFQQSGVLHHRRQFLYISTRYSYNISPAFWSRARKISSGPGDLKGSKQLLAHLTLSLAMISFKHCRQYQLLLTESYRGPHSWENDCSIILFLDGRYIWGNNFQFWKSENFIHRAS